MTASSIRSFALLGLVVLAGVAATALPAGAQSIVAMVNGEPITNNDIDQRIKLMMMSSQQRAPARKDVLEDLISDKVKVREAKRYNLELSTTELETAYANMGQRMRMTPDQLSKTLEARGVRPETLKARIKADVTWTQLVRGRFPQSLLVGEKDIIAVVGKPSGQATDNFDYQLRSIVMVVPRGSGSSAVESRRREAEALRQRVTSCEQAAEIFGAMADATIKQQVVKTSGDLPPSLRATLDKTPIGQLTAPEVTRAGVEMVALCGKKTSTADTPAEREARDRLFAQRFEAKANQYLKDVRRTMMIEYR